MILFLCLILINQDSRFRFFYEKVKYWAWFHTLNTYSAFKIFWRKKAKQQFPTYLKRRFGKKLPPQIAILTSDQSPYTKKTVRGFSQALERNISKPYILKTYEARSNLKELRDFSVEIAQQAFDAVLTVDIHATQTLKEIADRRGANFPIIFTGVKNPDKIGIIKSLRSSKNNFTGVTGINFNYEKEIEFLQFLKPKARKILIVGQKSDPWASPIALKIALILQKRKLQSHTLFAHSTQHLLQESQSFLADSGTDTIITLRNSLIFDSISELAKLAQTQGVTLFASDSSSVQAGAALGFGEADEMYGVLAAIQMMKILEEHQHPSNIPTLLLNAKEKLCINIAALKKQGLFIPDVMLSALDYSKIYRSK